MDQQTSDREFDAVPWRAPGMPPVRFSRRVMQGIAQEVAHAHARGQEAGGILAGRRQGGEIVIEDFEPAPSEHPAYRLSESDLQGLEETLQWFGDRVLGFYRSHSRLDFVFDAADRELLDRYFADPSLLFLLLKPLRDGRVVGDFFFRYAGQLREATRPAPFPFEAVVRESPPTRPVATPPPLPDFRPEPQEQARSRVLRWAGLALVLTTVAAAVLGYLSGSPRKTGQPSVAQRLPAGAGRADRMPQPQEPVAPAVPAGSVEREVRAALDGWAQAQRSGNAGALVACYAPPLERYFRLTNASQNDVRRTVKTAFRRYGRLAILRLEDVRITPEGPGRAAATFRKHWQTAGPRIFAGEEQERLVLVKRGGAWKIVSEEEQRVYWTHRPR